jgi:hypothetical protein
VLYDRKAHEPLRGGSWDARRARRAIDDIVDDTLDCYDGGWPAHPLDDRPGVGIYAGPAGVGYARRSLGAKSPASASELLGETDKETFIDGALGIGLAAWREQPSEELAARIERAAETVIANGENELCRGAAGAAVTGMLLFDATRDERWARITTDAVRILWSTWTFDRSARACLWRQRRPDGVRQYLGAAHGVAGNVYALLRAAPLQTPDHQREVLERVVEALEKTALRERALANWPARADDGDPRLRVQWCHGAPGIVTALAGAPAQARLTELLVAGGELTWEAGPPAKGPGLCHGTAGNGFAFLKLYSRTRDERWLARARRFAMHAATQVDALRDEHGMGRYSLWTGDLGVGLYLRACIEADDRWPLLDVL